MALSHLESVPPTPSAPPAYSSVAMKGEEIGSDPVGSPVTTPPTMLTADRENQEFILYVTQECVFNYCESMFVSLMCSEQLL